MRVFTPKPARSKPTELLFAALSMALLLASAAGAQTTPPPPRAAPAAKAEPADPTPGPQAEEPIVAPKASRADDLRGDIADQSAIGAIDREAEQIRKMVLEARMSAQRFHIARARLNEIIQAGKCGGSASVLKTVDRQEADTRTLIVSLGESCKGVSEASGGPLAKMCGEERRKLEAELEGFKEDRDAVRRMCAAPTN